VTVLFADLTGSTALGEQLDPERLRALLARYFGEMTSVVESWGGTVDKFIGDAVVAVFGIPAIHEDDGQRALMAALDMQSRLADLNPQLAGRHGVQLAMRIGVNTGEVVAGGERDRLGLTADAVNVASRLQQTAQPGEIVVGERTYLQARGSFVLEALPDRALKGKSLPVRLWRLLGRAEAPRRAVVNLSTRLVGRERELGLLATVFGATVEDGRPRLLTILGLAGVGKSRLVEEFVNQAQADGMTPLAFKGRCLPYGRGITYWALREILWSGAGILLDDVGEVAGEKLRKLVRDVIPDDATAADRVTFALGKTAGISLPENPLERMSPESIGEELGLAWPRFLSGLAAERPLLVEIEDLHWAESPLLDMIEHLVARSTGPILILATARPEFAETRPGWGARSGMSQIGLEPLPEADLREFLGELLPRVGAALRERVLLAAEGNPFFAEEIVGHLIDEGFLERRQEELVEGDPEAAITIPDTVRALLAARVDALLPDEKRTLQDAAVVGRTFWATTLDAMRPVAPLREALRGLEAKGLVVTRPASSLEDQIELSFRHGLIREVAYQSIPKARRARAHAEVGRWIEKLVGDRREEFVELIAHHYESAAQPENADLAWPADSPLREEIRSKAVVALLDAGWAARARFAIDEAIGFGERALALGGGDADRLAALELKALAGHAGVRADQAWSWYLDALKLAERTNDRKAATRLRAHSTLLWSRYRGAFAGDDWKGLAAESVRRGLQELDPDEVSFERGALVIGRAAQQIWELVPGKREEALRDAEEAVEIAERLDSPVLLSYALDTLAGLLKEDGFCRSAELAERTLRASRSMDDRLEAHELLVTSALAFAESGQFDAAEEVAAEAARQASELSPHHRLHAASAQASCLLPGGRMADLLDATRQATDLVVEEGMHTCFHGIRALAGEALSLYETGDEVEATRVLEIFEATKPTTSGSAAAAYEYQVAEILRPLLGLEETGRRLEQVEGHETVQSEVYRLRVELPVAALNEDWDRLQALVAEARTLSGRACAPYLAWIADWADAVRIANTGHPTEALTRATEASSALELFGERYAAARLLVELLLLLPSEVVPEIAAETAGRLETMGALTSAGQARLMLRYP
jgi:class 3 adenylate cyclase